MFKENEEQKIIKKIYYNLRLTGLLTGKLDARNYNIINKYVSELHSINRDNPINLGQFKTDSIPSPFGLTATRVTRLPSKESRSPKTPRRCITTVKSTEPFTTILGQLLLHLQFSSEGGCRN